MAAVTRLGLHGGPRAPYAGFVAAPATDTARTKGGWNGTEFENWRSREHRKRLKALLLDDEEVATMLLLEIIRG